MRLDHDFFFVQSANKPDVNNALVVSPDKTKEKEKREKKDEEPELLLCFSWSLYLRFCISDIETYY